MKGRRYLWSVVIALVLTVLVGMIASISDSSMVGVLLAPGMFAAAIVFRTGIHSDWPVTYMVVAVLMNLFLLSWLVLGTWVLIGRARQSNHN